MFCKRVGMPLCFAYRYKAHLADIASNTAEVHAALGKLFHVAAPQADGECSSTIICAPAFQPVCFVCAIHQPHHWEARGNGARMLCLFLKWRSSIRKPAKDLLFCALSTYVTGAYIGLDDFFETQLQTTMSGEEREAAVAAKAEKAAQATAARERLAAAKGEKRRISFTLSRIFR